MRPGIDAVVDGSDVEKEVTDVAVLHHVFFTLDTQFPRFPDGLFALIGDEIFQGVYFRPNESSLEIGVNDARRLKARWPR